MVSPHAAPPASVSIGLDIGSTTVKAVVTDADGQLRFSCYERHNARIRERVSDILGRIGSELGQPAARLVLTGSIGLGVAERCGLAFIQEVVAATRYVGHSHPQVKTLIDIGGEDAKVVFFRQGQAVDLRMNGSCAGGTGAFIDQMAILLGLDNTEMDRQALQATQTYAIASRCGVFCKTDVQNLVAKNAALPDIAKSIFHAVAVQTVVTLSHGNDIEGPILFCGGPLSFLPSLRQAFQEYLHKDPQDFILPEQGQLVPAWGAALQGWQQEYAHHHPTLTPQQWTARIAASPQSVYQGTAHLKPLFTHPQQLADWQAQKQQARLLTTPCQKAPQKDGSASTQAPPPRKSSSPTATTASSSPTTPTTTATPYRP